MNAWLKGVLLSALAFGGSWSGAVWYWRSTKIGRASCRERVL